MVNLGTPVYGSAVSGLKRIEGRSLTVESYQGRKIVANTNIQPSKRQYVDIDWLPAAAESYHISADISDYVIVPVPIVTSDVPNRNLQAFPNGEITYFDPIHGTFVYNTFKGKPTHIDHRNEDPTQAKGVIFSSYYTYVPRYRTGKIITLCGFDRSKDRRLANSIISGERDSYSMGAFVTTFVCSICHTPYSKEGPKACPHQLDPQAPTAQVINGKLNYMNCRSVCFFETSSVGSPADISAFHSAEELLSVSL